MLSVSLNLTGIDKLQSVFDSKRFDEQLVKTMRQATQLYADETKKLPPVSAKTTGYGAKGIPVDTGRMRQGIRPLDVVAVAAGVTGAVIADTNYSGLVQDGTSKMPPRPFFRFAYELGVKAKLETMFTNMLSTFFGV